VSKTFESAQERLNFVFYFHFDW